MILFAVNDAGPAKYLAHIAKSLKNEKYLCLVLQIGVNAAQTKFLNPTDNDDILWRGRPLYGLRIPGLF